MTQTSRLPSLAQDYKDLTCWLPKYFCSLSYLNNYVNLLKFLQTLHNWQDMILNFADSGITNAVTEGFNNVIRYIRRISFAIPNFDHVRLRVLTYST